MPRPASDGPRRERAAARGKRSTGRENFFRLRLQSGQAARTAALDLVCLVIFAEPSHPRLTSARARARV